MARRISQPPINPRLRSTERREFWPGFIVAILGAVLLSAGVRRVTALATVEGNSASETQLMKAFSSGGLEYTDTSAPPPPIPDDPAATAHAMERWERENARRGSAPSWSVRVDTGAKTPCPT